MDVYSRHGEAFLSTAASGNIVYGPAKDISTCRKMTNNLRGRLTYTLLFFYKNMLYKNVEAEIPRFYLIRLRTLLHTSSA